MRKITLATALILMAASTGCSFIGDAIGVGWCPVWTPVQWVFGLLGG
jgi:hypothetical protein